jgi:hypothetical protein
MKIDWRRFAPWASLSGGFIIALAMALYLPSWVQASSLCSRCGT